jgi:glyoxylase-like metal-dependent hydrolase (beta-lactamase superfamily II)
MSCDSRVCRAAALCVALTLASGRQARAQAGVPAEFLHVAGRIAPGVHVLRQPETNYWGAVGNVLVVDQADGVVLVDAGASYGFGARVVEHVRRITHRPVKAVLITHWHNDHSLGVSAIVKTWPKARILATPATRDALASGRTGWPLEPGGGMQPLVDETREMEADASKFAADAARSKREREQWRRIADKQAQRRRDAPGTHVVLPTEIVTDRVVLDDPEAPVEALFLGRANTSGDLVAWLPRQRVVATGDVVVSPVPFMFNIYPAEQVAALARIKALGFAVLVPGHGAPQHDQRYVDSLIAFIQAARGEAARLFAAGETPERSTLDMDAWRARLAGPDPWHTRWFDDYAAGPLMDSAFREASGAPLGPPP